MRAVRIHTTGGPEVLQIDNIATPEPRAGDVLVQVEVAGVNFIDTYQRSGLYPLPLPIGLGREGSGRVIALGSDVRGRSVGDRVAWIDTNGSYAEQVVVDADRTVLVPDGVDLTLAGAGLLQGLTAHYLVESTAKLGPEDTVLVYAAAGGVGRILVQLAKRLGTRVLACTSTAEKAEIARGLGADEVILYRDRDIAAEVRDLTNGRGVDVVYDSVGKDTFDSSIASLRPRGLLALYGASSGPVPPVDPQILKSAGSLFLTRPALTHYTATHEELKDRASDLFELLATGELDLKIYGEYPLETVVDAHRDLESGTTSGKLILRP